MLVSQNTVDAVVAALSVEHNISEVERSFINEVMLIENYQTSVAGVVHHEVDGEGSFQGLGQFDVDTWNGLVVNGWSLPPYDTAVCSTWWDVSAILFLLRDNQSVYKRQFKRNDGYPDMATAYLYHNQGATAAKAFLLGRTEIDEGQSDHAQTLFATIDRSPYTNV